mmetsp:Transcript_150506/g.288398  ORF Transcript_150506/g.288398 Transcript_150506/m.288398 type:complete len:577 (-) Transcript_150506:204-1934(-)
MEAPPMYAGGTSTSKAAGRDMRRELEEWRSQKRGATTPTRHLLSPSCFRNNENMSPSNWMMPRQVFADGTPGGKTPLDSSSRTPVKRRKVPLEAGGVQHNAAQANAVSPLMEICQNNGMLTMSGRRGRASPRAGFSPLCGSPSGAAAAVSPPWGAVAARAAGGNAVSPRVCSPRATPAREMEVPATSAAAVVSFLSLWEEKTQAFRAPPPSPATPFQAVHGRPSALEPLGLRVCTRDASAAIGHCLAAAVAAEFQDGAPAGDRGCAASGSPPSPCVFVIATPAQPHAVHAGEVIAPQRPVAPTGSDAATPERRRLELTHLEETELEDFLPAADSSQALQLSSMDPAETGWEMEVQKDSSELDLLIEQGLRELPECPPHEHAEAAAQSPAPLLQDMSLITLSDLEKSNYQAQLSRLDESEASLQSPAQQRNFAEELATWRASIEEHALVWTNPTILDMEDHLSRAHDIEAFWFFEARDRANMAVQSELLPEPCRPIPEYPTDWPQWKIDSFNTREAVRTARADPARRDSQQRPPTVAAVPAFRGPKKSPRGPLPPRHARADAKARSQRCSSAAHTRL